MAEKLAFAPLPLTTRQKPFGLLPTPFSNSQEGRATALRPHFVASYPPYGLKRRP